MFIDRAALDVERHSCLCVLLHQVEEPTAETVFFKNRRELMDSQHVC